jgi:hypothetical protein
MPPALGGQGSSSAESAGVQADGGGMRSRWRALRARSLAYAHARAVSRTQRLWLPNGDRAFLTVSAVSGGVADSERADGQPRLHSAQLRAMQRAASLGLQEQLEGALALAHAAVVPGGRHGGGHDGGSADGSTDGSWQRLRRHRAAAAHSTAAPCADLAIAVSPGEADGTAVSAPLAASAAGRVLVGSFGRRRGAAGSPPS